MQNHTNASLSACRLFAHKPPTALEERIAAAGDPDRPATPEEIKLAGASAKQLMAEKTGDVGAALDPQLALKRQLGRYHELTRPKMTATKVYKCREHLERGEDPFLLALYFNADFTAVANIANDVLRVRAERKGLATFQTIPVTVPGYLALAEKMREDRERSEVARASVARDEVVSNGPDIVSAVAICAVKASEVAGASASRESPALDKS